jgi:hypothetical protein
MIRGEPLAGSSEEAPVVVPAARRERVVVRRRRGNSRPRTGRWTAARSRRRILRAAVVCTGVLLLMAVGLYLGLSRQDTVPAESRLHGPALAVSSTHG